MLTFNYRKKFINMTERIGYEDLSVEFVDVKTDILMEMELLFSQEEVKKFKEKKHSVYLVMPCYIVDLNETETEIFKRMHRSTKYEINRAMKRDDLEFVEYGSPTNEQIVYFSLIYNSFAKELKISKCDVNRLKAIRDCGALVISYITKDNQILCSTAYLIDGNHAYGIYSSSGRFSKEDSIDRNVMGRANRYLHWRNIQSSKNRGCKWYNFGGQFTNHNDEQGQNVNKFKMSFGPTLAYDAKRFTSKNILSRLILFVYYLKWKDLNLNDLVLYEKNDIKLLKNNE